MRLVDKTSFQANNIVTENKQENNTDMNEAGSIFDEEALNIESWDQTVENYQNPDLVTDEIEEQNENSSEDQVKKARSGRTLRRPMRYISEDGRWQEKRDQVSFLEESQNGNKEEIAIVYVPKERQLDPDIIKASRRELQNLKDFEVLDEIEDGGQKRISTQWVVVEKEYQDGSKGIKARLVVRGSRFEEENIFQVDILTTNKAN